MAKVKSGAARIGVNLFAGPTVTLDDRRIELSSMQSCLVAVVFGGVGIPARGPNRTPSDPGRTLTPNAPISRQKITCLLWGRDSPRARHRLSQLLYATSKRCDGGSIFRTTTKSVAPGPAMGAEDLAVYRQALEDGALDDALALHKKGFLGRIREVPCRSFEEWEESRRASVRNALRDRADFLWSEWSEGQSWDRALSAAHVLLALDPYDEEALRRSLLAGGMVGKTGEALAVYREFSERRRSDRGEWSPDAETRTLIERLERLPPVPIPPLESSDRAPEQEPKFCGREKELTQLNRLVGGPIDGASCDTVVVTGEGGIGKTRLVSESLRTARLNGYNVLMGRSSEFERHIPLNPLLEALSADGIGDVVSGMGDPWRSVLLTLLPGFLGKGEPIPEVPYLDPGHVPRRTYEALTLLLAAVAEPGPVLLFLDDFQWADETSIAAVEFIRRRWSSGRLVIVLAIRSSHPGQRQKADEFIDEIEANGEGTIIALEELEEEAVRKLIRSISGNDLSHSMREHIAVLSGRNPFFAVELTNECASGHMKAEAGSDAPIPIPVSVRQLLERRVRGLEAGDEEVLALLAVSGRALSLDQIDRFTGRTRQECALSVDGLRALRLVRWETRGATIHHPLVRHAAYDRIPPAQKCVLHERVAGWLADLEGIPPGELALHYDRAGLREMALEHYLEAADRAEEAGAVAEAMRFLTAARGNADGEKEATTIVGRLGSLLFLHRDFNRAVPLLEIAATRYREQGCLAAHLKARTKYLDALMRLEQIPREEFLRETQMLKQSAQSSGSWEAYANLLTLEVYTEDRAGNVDGVLEALSEAERVKDRGSIHARCASRAILALHFNYGSPQTALVAAREAVAIAQESGNVDQLLLCSNRLIATLIHMGRLSSPEGIAIVELAERIAESSGDIYHRFHVPLNRGVWHLDVGEAEDARIQFERAAKVASELQDPEIDSWLCFNRAELSYVQGRFEEAHRKFSKLISGRSSRLRVHIRECAVAGIGLCELALGRFAEANARERQLSADTDWWVYDRYLAVLFRTLILRRSGEVDRAASYLRENANRIQDRFVPTWLKLLLAECRLLIGTDDQAAYEAAREGMMRADALKLEQRQTEFAQILNALA